MSVLSDSVRQSDFSFKSSTARVRRWAILSCGMLFCPAPVVVALPDRLIKGGQTNAVATAYLVLWMLSLVQAVRVSLQERKARIAATLHAPEAQYLPLYILAYCCDGEKMRDRMALIVCELLGRMSEDELACLPEDYWRMLCPPPKITPTGYSAGERVGRDDPVHAAVFSAVRRLKRIESLSLIESWMQHLDPQRHTETYVRTLTECYETLKNVQENTQQQATLLRASSAEATAGMLLRPIGETSLSLFETGEQLLRSATARNPRVTDRKDAALSGSAFEQRRGN